MNVTSRLPILLVVALAMSSPVLAQGQSESGVTEPCTHDVDACVRQLRHEFANRGILGLLVPPPEGPTRPGEVHWKVSRVLEGGPAYRAGLREGDLITLWDGKELPVGSPEQITGKLKVGQKVAITVSRDGVETVLSAVTDPPTEQAIDTWLLIYVHDHFDDATFKAYERQAIEKRQASQQRG